MLDRLAVAAAEPAVNPEVCAGALFLDDATIDNPRLVDALVSAARRRGVEFRLRTSVRSVVAGPHSAQVQTDGETLDAAHVVVAAGAWCGDVLADQAVKVPLRPARGEMAALRSTTWSLHRPLSTGDGYLVPRCAGEVLVGSTTAFVGFDKRVTAAGVSTLLAHAAHMVPRVREATLVRTWAGLRPCPTIRRPIIAPLRERQRVLLATGHHRNGILLAPITAQLVTEMIVGAPPSLPLHPFSYRRH
jgi:glycine oxidase